MVERLNTNIHIFAGHFGSGKTEMALNFAMNEKRFGNDVTVVDMDTVNPYFRANDVKRLLTENGIRLIAGQYASTNLDMPIVPAEVRSVFEENGGTVIFDVGGDDDGAYALGVYRNLFEKFGYQMHFVVNTKRPLTRKCEELLETAIRIEEASRLKFTDIFNNTNLSYLTDENTLLSGYDEILRLSELMKIPAAVQCGMKKALAKMDGRMEMFEIERYLAMPV